MRVRGEEPVPLNFSKYDLRILSWILSPLAPSMSMANENTAKSPNQVAREWAGKYPELSERLERAVALVANVAKGDVPDTFYVEGSFGHHYVVKVDRSSKRRTTCTCPDHQKRHLRCKHIWACALVETAN